MAVSVGSFQGQLLPNVKVSQFFDRLAVTQRLDKSKLKYLRRAGGAVRKTARRSIRKRKGISPPGQPPHSHEGSLRNGILFGLDQYSESVVIGPTTRYHSKEGHRLRGAALLEFGGYTQEKGGRQLFYRPRPYMWPALEKIEPQLPRMFAEAYQ